MITRSRTDEAARFRAYADQLRAEAADADNEHDRQQLLEQANSFDLEADRLTKGERDV